MKKPTSKEKSHPMTPIGTIDLDKVISMQIDEMVEEEERTHREIEQALARGRRRREQEKNSTQ